MEFGWCSDCDAQQFAPAEIGQALHVQDRPVSVGKHAQSFAAPHPNDAHSRRLTPVCDFIPGELPAGFQIAKTSRHSAHECTLLLCLLEFSHRLHDSHAAPPT